MIEILLFISDNCSACKKVEEKITHYSSTKNFVSLKVLNINDCDSDHAIIVPALYINGTLYAYGEFDMVKMNNYLNNNLN